MSIVRSAPELHAAVERARDVSRSSTVVAEHFHDGPELTINAWIADGEAVEVAVLDRITVNPPPAIGICLQHVTPSVHAADLEELSSIAERVAAAYGVQRGPLYIQTIASTSGYRVIEAASRVGGGHEAQLLPRVVSFDLIDRVIDLALDRPEPPMPPSTPPRAGLVNFIVASPGRIERLGPVDALVEEGLVDEGGWYVSPGHVQGPITDSMARIGYFIVTAPTRAGALQRAERAYARLTAEDGAGNNLITWPPDDIMNRPVA